MLGKDEGRDEAIMDASWVPWSVLGAFVFRRSSKT
jgi:hypothetical protein